MHRYERALRPFPVPALKASQFYVSGKRHHAPETGASAQLTERSFVAWAPQDFASGLGRPQNGSTCASPSSRDTNTAFLLCFAKGLLCVSLAVAPVPVCFFFSLHLAV
jgi:hypothetical protein